MNTEMSSLRCSAKALDESAKEMKVLVEMARQSDKQGFDRALGVEPSMPNSEILPGAETLIQRLTTDVEANRKQAWLQGYDEVVQHRAQEFKFRIQRHREK